VHPVRGPATGASHAALQPRTNDAAGPPSSNRRDGLPTVGASEGLDRLIDVCVFGSSDALATRSCSLSPCSRPTR